MTDLKTTPLLMSAPMVRALLEGRKTQTRRVVKLPDGITEGPQYYAPPSGKSQQGWADPGVNYWTNEGNHIDPCPYGQPGSLIWVREKLEAYNLDLAGALGIAPAIEKLDMSRGDVAARYAADKAPCYAEGEFDAAWMWKNTSLPSIHMPRWASRLTLELTSVRVERLQDISEEDAAAEGGLLSERYEELGEPNWPDFPSNYREAFSVIWQSINGPNSWAQNPWVWVLEFTVHQQNIDEFLKARAA